MKTFFVIFTLLAAAATVSAVCTYEPVTANAFVSETGGVFCNDVPETTGVGQSVCEFVVSGAAGILLLNGSPPNIENSFSLSTAVTSTILVRVIVKSTLSNVVDTADTVDALTGQLACVNTEGGTDTVSITITIQEENNNNPQFDETSYDIRNVNRSLPAGTDITVEYGVTILVSDYDNSKNPTESNVILTQITDYRANFEVQTVLVDSGYPRTYQVHVILLEPTFLNLATTYIQATNPVGQVIPTEATLQVRFLDEA